MEIERNSGEERQSCCTRRLPSTSGVDFSHVSYLHDSHKSASLICLILKIELFYILEVQLESEECLSHQGGFGTDLLI